MRIERINENSISCTLTSFDLSVRNLNIRELAYGSEKAKKLFDEMMTKAGSEVGFHAENTPIMIEAIPLSSDSIKLIISKVPNPEELDARFSRFTQNPNLKKEAENWLNRITAALLEGTDGLAGEIKKLAQEQEDSSAKPVNASDNGGENSGTDGSSDSSSGSQSVTEFRAFAFDDLDVVIEACKASSAFNVKSKLYKNPVSGQYVLAIMNPDSESDDFAKACNIVAEYGRMIKTVQNTLSYYEEHYGVIVKQDAIQKLASV